MWKIVHFHSNIRNSTMSNITTTSRYSDITLTATPAIKGPQVKLLVHLWAVMVLSPLSLLAALDAGCALLLKQFRVGLDNTERLVREFGRSRADSSKEKHK